MMIFETPSASSFAQICALVLLDLIYIGVCVGRYWPHRKAVLAAADTAGDDAKEQ